MEPKEILDTVKTAVGENVKPMIDEVKASVTGVSDSVAKIEERVKAIEALPLGKAPAIIRPKHFMGRNLELQGQVLKNHMKDMEYLNTEERIDEFNKFMISLIHASGRYPTPDAQNEMRKFLNTAENKTAMNITTDAQGGYLVPTEFQWDIIKLARAKYFAINECRIYPMSSDTLKLPKELVNITVAWSEEAAMSEAESTFDQMTLSAKDLDGYSIVSNDLLMDSAMDVPSMLTEQFSSAILLELDNQVLNGTGAPWSGVLTTAAGESVVMASGAFSTLTADDLSNMEAKIDDGYDINLMYVFHKTIKHYIRTLKDGMDNYIYAQPSLMTPGTIWENRYFVSSKAPSTTGTSTAFVVLGNFQQFALGRRSGVMTLEVDPYGAFTTKQTRFRMVTRWGGSVGQADAFCRLVTSA